MRCRLSNKGATMMIHTHQIAPTQFVEANGIRFAYRRFGVPIVFNPHGSPVPISQAVRPARFPVPVRRGSAMKLYHSASSPNSRRVRIFLAEKGLSIPLVTVDLGKGEQHSDAYRAINPRRVVPTLVLEDGTAIGEVPAICRYIEEVFPQTPLFGQSEKDKAFVK